ncbi:MAG TPA: hypothetical protein VF461_15160 [Gemmatimonadaceae bacterium]
MSTAAATSAADASAAHTRSVQRFGRIVIVGGGCYGSYYLRQLDRAQRASAVEWDELVVVDRDPACAVGQYTPDELPPRARLVAAEWHRYFDEYLASAARDPARRRDAIVPSPLMPHLMADWLAARARQRWPDRAVRTEPLLAAPGVPWQRAGEDGTHYVSFAKWMCPINCIEPARCPHTRGPRSWSLPIAVREYADAERTRGREVEPLVFHCTHRTYGVGMIDVADVVDADATIESAAARGGATFLIGTVSHCHGALRRLVVG